MRLWYSEMFSNGSIPSAQLCSQWRELIAIKRKICLCGTPEHRLVNSVLDYNIIDFKNYTRLIYDEMCNRDYKVNINLLNEITMWKCDLFNNERQPCGYDDWLEGRWLETSIYNLQEKAIVGIVPYDEWVKLYDVYNVVFNGNLWKRK